MFRFIRFYIIVTFVITGMVASPALAEISSGSQNSGAVYRICLPDNWNGDLVVFAHSYVPPGSPLQISEEDLKIQDTYLPDVFTAKGYAAAVTSYSKTGLAVVQGVADVVDLVGIFKKKWGNPRNVYLVGVSQGGLICTLAVEQNPGIFSGGLSLCGPIGDFRRQINYWGDFRVVFDYFFPKMIPPTAVDIPLNVVQNWQSNLQEIIDTISHNSELTGQMLQLLMVTRAAIDPNDLTSAFKTLGGLLTYNVIATNDGTQTLLGHPFDNLKRVYSGSSDDNALNQGVNRYTADTTALDEIEAHYQTSGLLQRPLVSMHTQYDPIVPYWHEALYQDKIKQHGLAANYTGIPINSYGHVNFTINEVLNGFALLVNKVEPNKLNKDAVSNNPVMPNSGSQ